MASLDEIDRQIISRLQVEGRRSFTSLAEDLGVGVSVIRYRVNRLEQSGVLQIVGIADPLKIGFDMMALVGVKIESQHLDEVTRVLANLPATSYLASTAGSFDAFIEVVCRDTMHFRSTLKDIQKTEGVVSTETFLITEIHKMAYGWGVGDTGMENSATSSDEQ